MVKTHQFEAVTEITVLAQDHPRLLSVIAGACAGAGGNIVDAQIFTTSDGRALDTILISREFDRDEDERRRAERVGRLIEDVLSGKSWLPEMIEKRTKPRRGAKVFSIPPRAEIRNTLSNRFSVIEVEGLDRPGLLSEITGALSDLSLDIASAHITTFGEKVIDTFYVTDLTGQKIDSPTRIATIHKRLIADTRRHRAGARRQGQGGRRVTITANHFVPFPRSVSPRMSLVKKFATVASGTLMSRALGFGREMLMAAALGTGPVADAFNAAFQFPNTFRRLFAEGAFNAAFVPLFAKEIETHGTDGAKRFSEEVFGVLFTALLALTIVMELAMPLIVRYLVAPGFADTPGKFETTVRLATIMFPYLICMSLGAMMAGMLNSLRRYFAAAVAPVFLNIILIGVLGLCLVQRAWTPAPSASACPGACSRRGWCSSPSSGWRCAMPASRSAFAGRR